eukprot:15464143-Alexandrium_andersonii.AAC.1
MAWRGVAWCGVALHGTVLRVMASCGLVWPRMASCVLVWLDATFHPWASATQQTTAFEIVRCDASAVQ